MSPPPIAPCPLPYEHCEVEPSLVDLRISPFVRRHLGLLLAVLLVRSLLQTFFPPPRCYCLCPRNRLHFARLRNGCFSGVPTVTELLNPPTAAESLEKYKPQTEEERAIDDFIKNHPLAQELRSKEGFTEARPHMKIPDGYRPHHLTGGLLAGPARIVVPPLVFTEDGGKSIVAISYLGNDLCGHPGIIHGGLLATMLDEGLAWCCFAALPHNMGVTANLNINYRSPAKADSYVVLRATTTKVEGRKAWVEGRMETLAEEGETPVVLAEATALFVTPKQAAVMTNIFPSN
ncbi:hypothetical protein EKO27_g8466 [Xylaria grammica]|uniref:Thioesterase domain-containing protein n=1 Tax=Xylaria grammica TaxID=363999 RepID=A0A439CWP0_9PEZI|nr:hypothetical protein EKO27_g8466 [Xylaria grammica]